MSDFLVFVERQACIYLLIRTADEGLKQISCVKGEAYALCTAELNPIAVFQFGLFNFFAVYIGPRFTSHIVQHVLIILYDHFSVVPGNTHRAYNKVVLGKPAYG